MDRHFRHIVSSLAMLLAFVQVSFAGSLANQMPVELMAMSLTDTLQVADTTLFACEDTEEDSFALFFPLDAQYTGTDSTVVTYHLNDSLAQAGGDSLLIADLQIGYFAVDSTLIYVRVTDTIHDCFGVGQLVLRIRPRPEFILPESSVCAGDSILVSMTGQSPFTLSTSNGELDNATDSIYIRTPTSLVPDSTTLAFTLLTDSFGCFTLLSEQVVVHQVPSFDIVEEDVCQGAPWLVLVEAVSDYTLFSSNEEVNGMYSADSLILSLTSENAESIVIDSIQSNLSSGCINHIPDSILVLPIPEIADTSFSVCASNHSLDLDSIGQLLVNQSIDLFWSTSADISDTLETSIPVQLTSDTMLWFIAVNPEGCSVIDSTLIDLITPPQVNLGLDVELCMGLGDTIPISGISLIDEQFTTWEVLNGANPDVSVSLAELSELSLSATDPLSENVEVSLVVTTQGYMSCATVSDTLGVLLYPFPSLETVTPLGCEGDSIEISGISNSILLDYNWGSLSESSISVGNTSEIKLNSTDAEADGVIEIQLTSASNCVSEFSFPVTLGAYPNVDLLAFGQGDGDSYCIGEALSLSATEESTSYQWALPEGLSSDDLQSSQLLSTVIIDSLNAFVSLTQTNLVAQGMDILSCTSSDSIAVSARRQLCEIDSVYQLPGGIYIAIMSKLDSESNYYQWIDSNGESFEDEDELLVVLPGENIPVSIESSHYGENVCECSLDFSLGGIQPVQGGLRASPNPTTSDGLVKLLLPKVFQDKNVVLSLVDITGRIVFSDNWLVGDLYRELQLPGGQSGTFVLHLASDNLLVTKQLVIR